MIHFGLFCITFSIAQRQPERKAWIVHEPRSRCGEYTFREGLLIGTKEGHPCKFMQERPYVSPVWVALRRSRAVLAAQKGIIPHPIGRLPETRQRGS